MYALYNFFLHRKWSGPVSSLAFRTGLRLRAAVHAARNALGRLTAPTPRLIRPPARDRLKKILIVRVDRVGDIVLTTPMLRALRRALPDARIDWVVQKKYAGLLNSYEGWNEVFTWSDIDDRNEGKSLAATLRRQGYDAAVIASTAPAGYRLALEAGIPVRTGWDAKGYGYSLSAALQDDRAQADRHQVENNLKLLEPLGIFDPDPAFPFRETDAGRAQRDHFLQQAGIAPNEKILVLHPGSFSPRVRWAPERFAELAALAAANGMRTVLLGAGPVEAALVEDIRIAANAAVIPAVNTFDLEGLAAFLGSVHVFVGNSTGPMHVAASAGAWTLAVFGSRYPLDRHELWRPWGPKGVVIESRTATCCGMPWTCAGMPCLAEIPAAQVWEEVRRVWGEPPAGHA